MAPPAVAPVQRRVLIVEDNPVNAAVAEGYLAELGYASVWVTDGAAAVARSAEQRFDLILMDLNMPDMDGFAAAALIRQRDSEFGSLAGQARVPIVALTAHEAESYRDACLTAGMDDILSKPYKLAECARITREWIEAPRRKRQGDTLTTDNEGVILATVRNH